MTPRPQHDGLIHAAATEEVDGEAWRERMERWLDLQGIVEGWTTKLANPWQDTTTRPL